VNSRFERFTPCTRAVFLAIVVVMISISSSALAGTFGFKAGANVATVTGEGIDSETVTRGVAGFVASFNISKNFAIQPEFLFAGKGGKGTILEGLVTSSGASGTLKLGYVEVPVLLRYNPKVSWKVLPGIYTGPALGILTSAEAEGTVSTSFGGGPVITIEESGNVESLFKTEDFSWVIGGALGFKRGRALFELDIRYTHGLTEVDTISPASPGLKNRAISIGLAVHLGKPDTDA
jgi:hypothetical protein